MRRYPVESVATPLAEGGLARALVAAIVILSALFAGCGKDDPGARAYISIVGSSTVYPFATLVAERFGLATGYRTPRVESTGSGGGMKKFCAGLGLSHPDMTTSSRPIKATERRQCAERGVTEILEIKMGYDGIVLAMDLTTQPMRLRSEHIFLALAARVPQSSGAAGLVPNPYRHWSDIDARLPSRRIEVLGPPPTSGTRDSFVELAMERGCRRFPALRALEGQDRAEFRRVCHTLREDGHFIEAGEADNLIVQRLRAHPGSVGILGFSFLDQNVDWLAAASIDGAAANIENIAGGAYPISRPLYLYVKKANLGRVPGIREFLAELASERAMGAEGYLASRGLVPLTREEQARVRSTVRAIAAPQTAQL